MDCGKTKLEQNRKIKFYMGVKAATQEEAEEKLAKFQKDLDAYI